MAEAQPNITPIERLPALLNLWRWRYGLICALPGLAAAALGMIFWAAGRSADASHERRKYGSPRRRLSPCWGWPWAGGMPASALPTTVPNCMRAKVWC